MKSFLHVGRLLLAALREYSTRLLFSFSAPRTNGILTPSVFSLLARARGRTRPPSTMLLNLTSRRTA